MWDNESAVLVGFLSPRSSLPAFFHDLCPRNLPCPLASSWVWPVEALGRKCERRKRWFSLFPPCLNSLESADCPSVAVASAHCSSSLRPALNGLQYHFYCPFSLGVAWLPTVANPRELHHPLWVSLTLSTPHNSVCLALYYVSGKPFWTCHLFHAGILDRSGLRFRFSGICY